MVEGVGEEQNGSSNWGYDRGRVFEERIHDLASPDPVNSILPIRRGLEVHMVDMIAHLTHCALTPVSATSHCFEPSVILYV